MRCNRQNDLHSATKARGLGKWASSLEEKKRMSCCFRPWELRRGGKLLHPLVPGCAWLWYRMSACRTGHGWMARWDVRIPV